MSRNRAGNLAAEQTRIKSSIQQSLLGQQNKSLADQLAELAKDGLSLGAEDGIRRIELLCLQYDNLAPEMIYHLINLEGFRQEIEEAQARRYKISTLHYIRHSFSLAPLILTWASLTFAVADYQSYLPHHPEDRLTPFLTLWQQNFPGVGHFLPFWATAALDVFFLSIYLYTILRSHYIDNIAYSTANAFIERLQKQIDELVLTISRSQLLPFSRPEDLNKVTLTMKKVIDDALLLSQRLIDNANQESQRIVSIATHSLQQLHTNAQEAIERTNKQAQDAIERTNKNADAIFHRITPLLQAYDNHVQKFDRSLDTLQTRISDLTGQITTFSQQTADLNTGVQQIITFGQELNEGVNALHQSEQEVLVQLQGMNGAVATAMSGVGKATQDMEASTIAIMEATQLLEKSQQQLVARLNTNEGLTAQFQQDLLTLHENLQEFASSVNAIAQTSQTLSKHIQDYSTLGEEIRDRVTLLNDTQDGVRTQIENNNATLQRVTAELEKIAGGVAGTAQIVGKLVWDIDQRSQITLNNIDQRSQNMLSNMVDKLKYTGELQNDTARQQDKVANLLITATTRVPARPSMATGIQHIPVPGSNGNSNPPGSKTASPHTTSTKTATARPQPGVWTRIQQWLRG
jgi:hypothetical protein